MENRHFDFSFGDLHEEQNAVDKLIDSLLCYNASSISGSNLQKKNLDILSPVPVNKGRGRPPKVTKATPASPSPVNREQKPSLEAVIECLNKINAQNKKLLHCVEVLSDKIKKEENATSEISVKKVSADKQNELDSVNDRLEKIEQNLNATTLVCSGPAVADLLKPTTSGDTPNLERLKGDICRAVCGENITSVDVGNLQLSLYGRNKKCIRLHCTNSTSKLQLLKQARERRPQGIYVNEFLTTAKLKIFHCLRQLRKQHPEKIKSIFTRKGNILYTLQNSNQVFHASAISDLSNIIDSRSSEIPHVS